MADITSWPWPKCIQTEYKLFYVSRRGVNLTLSEMYYSDASYWIIIPVLDLGLASQVQTVTIADFGPFYIVSTFGFDTSNAVVRQMFVRDLYEGLAYNLNSFDLSDTLVCGTVLNYQGQFVGANVTERTEAKWSSLNSRSIIWSRIGSYVLDPELDRQAGNISALIGQAVKNHPQIYRLLRLGNSIIAYGDSSNVVLTPTFVSNIFTYGIKGLPGFGIRSGNHVDGDENIHGFIDSYGDFWTIEEGNKLTKRGYREYILELLNYTHVSNDYRTLVTFFPERRRFYISNGNKCLVINAYGAYHCHQMVSSVVKTATGVIATYLDNLDETAYVTTDRIDFNTRGHKSVEAMAVSAETNSASVTIHNALDWRLASTGTFTRSALHRTDPAGESGIHVIGVDFRLHTVISSYTNAAFYGFQSYVKFIDARYRRGIMANTGASQGLA